MEDLSIDFHGSAPSPHCGRLDEHLGHYWNTGARRRLGEPDLWCEGPPVVEGAQLRGKDFEQRA